MDNIQNMQNMLSDNPMIKSVLSNPEHMATAQKMLKNPETQKQIGGPLSLLYSQNNYSSSFSERGESAMLGGIPTQESFEQESLEVLRDNLSMMSIVVNQFQKNAAGRLTDSKLMQTLRENIKVLQGIVDECDDDTPL